MPKKLFTSVKTFAKNVAIHAKSVASRQESPAEALVKLRHDTKKLKQLLTPAESTPEHRKHAQKLLAKGRERFNSRDYAEAEKLFRAALFEDPQCGWACTFLGHALYHQGKLKEALATWKRAYEMDPASDAGLKAQKKLNHIERREDDYIAAYQERLGHK